MSGRPQQQVRGRDSILRKRSSGCPGPPVHGTQHFLRSWALQEYPVFFPHISGCGDFANWKQNNSSGREHRGKGTDGAGFLLHGTSQHIFCRCLGAACKEQPAEGQRGNQGCSLGFQLHLPVLSLPRYKSGGAVMSQPGLLRIRSPWTDQAGQTRGRTELAGTLCLLLPKSRISLETPTHKGGCARAHTHR